MAAPSSPYLTLKEAADYLRYSSAEALLKAIRPQGIPHVKRGRSYLFLPEQLDRWLAGTPADWLRREARAGKRSA